jgi:hypothetical protein
MVGHVGGLLQARGGVGLDEGGGVVLGDEVVEGADDVRQGLRELLQLHSPPRNNTILEAFQI